MTDTRVAVVTGGAYGIGRGIAEEFVGRGDNVVIADRDAERGIALASSLHFPSARALFVRTDIRIESQVQNLIATAFEAFGRIDVLCNNAGIESYKRPEEYTIDDWNAIHETNLRGAFLCAKYAFPFLKAASGSIVNISSVQALANEANVCVYAASKAGMLALTRGMALDFATNGIRVNAVCPGAIRTGMMEAQLKDHPNPEDAVEAIGRSIPLGRVGLPEDIAHAVYFLSSPQAAYVTGATLIVDGGLLSRLST